MVLVSTCIYVGKAITAMERFWFQAPFYKIAALSEVENMLD
jgi:hypothetical protein